MMSHERISPIRAQPGKPNQNFGQSVRHVDCAIIGGGPAGLSAAVCLARMRRSVLVVDDRDGRSLWGQTNRNYLGFPDGIPAAEIRLAGRRQAARYGTKFLSGRVSAASQDEGVFHFRVEAAVVDSRTRDGRPRRQRETRRRARRIAGRRDGNRPSGHRGPDGDPRDRRP
jgi:glycine/D-amino acid oxidase-like deaminating enzyme